MTRREYESRRITRLHNEWLAKRGLPVGNRFNRWEKAKSEAVKADEKQHELLQ